MAKRREIRNSTAEFLSAYLQNIYETDELKKEATTGKISVVRRESYKSY